MPEIVMDGTKEKKVIEVQNLTRSEVTICKASKSAVRKFRNYMRNGRKEKDAVNVLKKELEEPIYMLGAGDSAMVCGTDLLIFVSDDLWCGCIKCGRNYNEFSKTPGKVAVVLNVTEHLVQFIV